MANMISCNNLCVFGSGDVRAYVHQQPMVPDHGTQHEGNPSSHDGGMHKDGLTDGLMHLTLSYIPRFCLGGSGNNNIYFNVHVLS